MWAPMAPNPTNPVCIRVIPNDEIYQTRRVRLCAAVGKADAKPETLSGAIASRVDFAFRVGSLRVDFFGSQILTLAVGAGFVDAPAFDQFLVLFLRGGTLLVFHLLNIAVHGFLGARVILPVVLGAAARRRRIFRRRGTSDMSAEQFHHFRMHAVRRAVAV